MSGVAFELGGFLLDTGDIDDGGEADGGRCFFPGARQFFSTRDDFESFHLGLNFDECRCGGRVVESSVSLSSESHRIKLNGDRGLAAGRQPPYLDDWPQNAEHLIAESPVEPGVVNVVLIKLLRHRLTSNPVCGCVESSDLTLLQHIASTCHELYRCRVSPRPQYASLLVQPRRNFL